MNTSDNVPHDATQAPAEMIRGICADCPFYDDMGGVTSTGQHVSGGVGGACRKAPPTSDNDRSLDGEIAGLRPGIFPMVRPIDWCGSHPLRAAAYTLGCIELEAKLKERRRLEAREARKAEGGRTSSGGHR